MANQFTGSPNGGMTVYYIQPSNNQKVTSFPKVRFYFRNPRLLLLTMFCSGLPHDRWRPHDPQQDIRRPQQL